MGQLYTLLLTTPIINGLLLFYVVFSKIGIPGAFGFAIITLTAAIRFLLNPIYTQQMHLSKKMEEIKPHLDTLSKKHKNDKQKLQEEQMKLYKEKGINPASGCLFALIQIPVFIGLYQVLNMFLMKGGIDKVAAQVNKMVYFPFLQITHIDLWFWGYNLLASPSQFQKLGYHYLLIPVITGALQYVQAKYTLPQMAKKQEGDTKKKEEDLSSIMSSQMKFMFPVMIGYLSFTFPVGLSLYWNMFSILSVIQYLGRRS